MQLIDSHCHLDDDRFDAEREQIIAGAAERGVTRMIVPATTANRWDKLKQLYSRKLRSASVPRQRIKSSTQRLCATPGNWQPLIASIARLRL